ncbi:Ribosome biogenesis protein YTM1 [Fasciola hepatica]|uniref:Protein KTI12 homolog n=1 Tax=Fasciola hepatica TaxID=6192 RepID=A0A4E0RF91_FASHE|nr:Ribosome biogenesis protein YTM1 [Fasciola hepatica]
MPLIIVCGYPCSGKSSVVAALVLSLQSMGFTSDVLVLPEPFSTALNGDNPRETIYADSKKERELRSHHKSEVERILSAGSRSGQAMTNPHRSVVIMDACNYIKGYRYELYCLAKSLKHPHAVLFCDTPRESVIQWNAKIQRYSNDLLLDMIARFEAPQTSHRWDSPLFTVQPHLWSSAEQIDVDSVAAELQQTVLSENAPSVKTNRSTQLAQVAPTDFLQEIERTTQSVVDHILQAQALGSQSVGLPSSFGSSSANAPQLSLINRPIQYSLPELTRFKRRYITLQKNNIADPTASRSLPDSSTVAVGFMNYIACSGIQR